MILPKRKKCSQCSKLSEGLQCTSCETAHCFTCADISTSDAGILKRQKNFKYECTTCCANESSSKKNTNKDLVNVIHLLQEQVKQLQQSLESIKTSKNMESNDDHNHDMDEVITEMNERSKREKNVILFDIKESNNSDLNERKSHDAKKFDEIVAKLGLNQMSPRNIVRLGKHDDDEPNKARPMKITLQTKGETIAILKNARIKHAKNIKSDLTPMQRSKLTSLRSKLQEKVENGDEGWTIRYIKGIPQLVKINIGNQKNSEVTDK
uniref:Uncharacterized protein n=1 Tax=Cacopsylla melanoneura TaxID=428564 RepID=A0A8D9FDN0_9HEMI